jgi:hypothetical protein
MERLRFLSVPSVPSVVKNLPEISDPCRMITVKQIESALERLPLEELQAVRDSLEDFIQDQLEVSDEFKAKIQRAKQEIADGVYSRVRKTETGE